MKYVTDRKLTTFIEQGSFGLEKESMRVTGSGYLSERRHPFPLDGIIDRDFCESQIELITPVCSSTEEVYETLKDIHQYVCKKLENNHEYLWKFSNPPYVDKEVKPAQFPEALKEKNAYRSYLADKYGTRMMLYSGIHFNYSFADSFLKLIYQESGVQTSFKDYKSSFYLKLCARAIEYSWLPTFLTAASPIFDLSLRYESVLKIDGFMHIASMRNSKFGYWNSFIPVLDYSSMEGYIESIDKYVSDGTLYSPAELYLPVRIKPEGENKLANLKEKGVSHIELRMLDLNPMEDIGVKKEELDFLHYFLVYLTTLEEKEFTKEEQIDAVNNQKAAAGYDAENIELVRGRRKVPLLQAAEDFLNRMEQFYESIGSAKGTYAAVNQKKKVYDREQRYAVQVYKKYHKNYVEKGIAQLKKDSLAV